MTGVRTNTKDFLSKREKAGCSLAPPRRLPYAQPCLSAKENGLVAKDREEPLCRQAT